MNSFITEASSVVHFYTTVQWIWSTGSCKLLRTNALCVVGEGKGREWGRVGMGGGKWVGVYVTSNQFHVTGEDDATKEMDKMWENAEVAEMVKQQTAVAIKIAADR